MTIAHEIPLDKAEPTPEHFKNDIGFSDAFVTRHCSNVRFATDENLWLTFVPGEGWKRDTTGTAIRALSADFARELYAKALDRAKAFEAQAGIKIVSEAAALGNSSRIRPMIGFAESNPAIAIGSHELDRAPFLVGVENGIVDLTDGQFSPHDELRLVTRRLATSFDQSATAPIFERFLEEVQPDENVRGFLQRWAGYCLTGAIREHVLPFHYGTGSNGKSIFLEHVLLRLLGSYGAKLSDSLIYATERGSQPFLEIAGLCGKRLAVGEENAAGAGLNENFLKSATGGDRQKGRYHYAGFIEYDPTAKLALVGNHRPRVEGRDHGFWRRFLLVDWPIRIPDERQDTALPEKLMAEMPGILNWCIAGAIAWQAEGLTPPNSCRAATEKFRTDSNVLAGFVDLFHASEDGWITKANVFELYRRWAQEEGIPVNRQLSKRSLSFRLIEQGWLEGKVGHEKYHAWLGIKEANAS